MFDTHCHLNFKVFKKNLEQVVSDAQSAGVTHILVPGTDVKTSKKAVEIAEKFPNIFAAVGIHPHHVYKLKADNDDSLEKNRLNTSLCARLKLPEITSGSSEPARSSILRDFSKNISVSTEIAVIEELLKHEKVAAVGEVGIDRHPYQKTQYEEYEVSEEFINLQKELLVWQMKLAIKYNKSLILHNREAIGDTLAVLNEHWDKSLEGHTVFHCCEPEEKLLDFAIEHKIYIGVDGDITYNEKKQEFIKSVPLELLVLETDTPFLLPEPLKSQKKYPNVPANTEIIAQFISEKLNISKEELARITSENSQALFKITGSTHGSTPTKTIMRE